VPGIMLPEDLSDAINILVGELRRWFDKPV
jgi:hypothetical protein